MTRSIFNPALKNRLLLLSNSTMPGTKYMEWVKEPVTSFLNQYHVKEILFIPFAAVTITYDHYANNVQEALPNFKVVPIHQTANYAESVKNAHSIMIGGGNTFHLLYKLYEHNLLDVIRDKVNGSSQTPYVGWSAGSNVAGPDIGSSNDMPIIWPQSDKALALVPYNLNPHYNEIKGKGETRTDRLNECVIIKNRPIVALSEGVGIHVENGVHKVFAPKDAAGEKDDRVVKVWTLKDGKPNITQLELANCELRQQLDNITSQ